MDSPQVVESTSGGAEERREEVKKEVVKRETQGREGVREYYKRMQSPLRDLRGVRQSRAVTGLAVVEMTEGQNEKRMASHPAKFYNKSQIDAQKSLLKKIDSHLTKITDKISKGEKLKSTKEALILSELSLAFKAQARVLFLAKDKVELMYKLLTKKFEKKKFDSEFSQEVAQKQEKLNALKKLDKHEIFTETLVMQIITEKLLGVQGAKMVAGQIKANPSLEFELFGSFEVE